MTSITTYIKLLSFGADITSFPTSPVEVAGCDTLIAQCVSDPVELPGEFFFLFNSALITGDAFTSVTVTTEPDAANPELVVYTATLTIQPVTAAHDGLYECVFDPGLPFEISRNFTVNVLNQPGMNNCTWSAESRQLNYIRSTGGLSWVAGYSQYNNI